MRALVGDEAEREGQLGMGGGPSDVPRAVVYEGELFRVVREQWPAGEREFTKVARSVAVVCTIDDELVLVEQLREPVRRPLLELPAGKIEPGEGPIDAALRELQEETGLRGGSARLLGSLVASPGMSNEELDVVHVANPVPGDARPDDGENVVTVRRPLAEVPSLLGRIEDAKTVAGLALLVLSNGHAVADQRSGASPSEAG